MSLFRKPKRIQHRSTIKCEDEDSDDRNNTTKCVGNFEKCDYKEVMSDNIKNVQKSICGEKKTKSQILTKRLQSRPVLSFADDDEDEDTFQVRKSSHSKKVMRLVNKERRKKKFRGERYGNDSGQQRDEHTSITSNAPNKINQGNLHSTIPLPSCTSKVLTPENKYGKHIDSVQTEIRTDDLVLVIKKSEPKIVISDTITSDSIKNGTQDEGKRSIISEKNERGGCRKSENLKEILLNGSIPDAAMIHAVRKSRQKAREQGNLTHGDEQKNSPILGKPPNRIDRDPGSYEEEERVDMNVLNGPRELEERRKQFYSAENEHSGDESDRTLNEWEYQQIRKGVTGLQMGIPHHESIFSRLLMNFSNYPSEKTPPSTFTLLNEAYMKNSLEKPRHLLNSKDTKENKLSVLRTPLEIKDLIQVRTSELKELNNSHKSSIKEIENKINMIKMEELEYSNVVPNLIIRYNFYQEMYGYVVNLVECLNTKAPAIFKLERRALSILSHHPTYLVERRRQDIRDEVKEISETPSKCLASGIRKHPGYEEQIKRTAERECRRTRRRCEREKCDMSSTHLDGMSSDDEIADQVLEQIKFDINELEEEIKELFADTNSEFYKIDVILSKFNNWRSTDLTSYNNSFANLCLPRILGLLIRTESLIWNPLSEHFSDIENMNWYSHCMLYGYTQNETEQSLLIDSDLNLVPAIIEKVLLPKISEIVTFCWDPMSSTQNLRLIGLINRIGQGYPIQDCSPSLQNFFNVVLQKMKTALNNDVFIPLFPKQFQEAKTSFFQRQFCSGLKLFRNFLSWQGIIADKSLRDLAISSLLNRYLLLAMQVCSTNDALNKAYVVVNTLPAAWLQPETKACKDLHQLKVFVKDLFDSLDPQNPIQMRIWDQAKQILHRLHCW